MRVLGRDWRRLTAGAEGFLTEESAGGVPGVTRGLVGQKVVWGEMDSFVSDDLFICSVSS